MADLKEVKSRIRIKRGPKTKMSGVTLPKGTPFYNETDNTLLISDGVTELDKHPIITTDGIHTNNWTITEDTNKELVITPKGSTDSIVIAKTESGSVHKKTTITPNYIKSDNLKLKHGDLTSLSDRSIQYGVSDIVTKILIFDASLIGKSTGGIVVESTGRSYVKIPHTTSTSGSLKINIRELNIPLLKPTMKLQFNFSWRNTNNVRNESSIQVVLETNGKFATISNNSIIDSEGTMLFKNITSALCIYWDNNSTYDASTVSNLSMAWFDAADVTYTNSVSQPSVNIHTEDGDYYPYLESIYLLNN